MGPGEALSALARFEPGGWAARALVGVGFALAVLLVRWAAAALYADVTGFMILLPGVILAALAAGRIAGVVATAGALGGGWLLVGATGAALFDDRSDWVATVNFVIVGLFCTWVASSLRDEVAGRARTQALLDEGERRFHLMADTAPAPVWVTNPDAEVEFVNKALVEFYGRPAEEILGSVWRATVHPDDREAVAAIMAEARPARRPYTFDARFSRADGTWRWMRVAVKPRFDGDGGFMGYIGMSFDLTETREALDHLAELERRQSLLLSLGDRLRDLDEPDAVMLEAARTLGEALAAQRVGYGEIDAAGETILVRRAWALPGTHNPEGPWSLTTSVGPAGADELRAGRTLRLIDPASHVDDPATAADYRAHDSGALIAAPVMRGGRLDAVLYAVRAEARAWTEDEAALVEEVAARAFAEVERTRAELEMRESEHRFRSVADTAPVLIWVTNADRSRAFVNQAYVAFHGGSYEDARTADWRAALHPEDHERIGRESLAGEATGKPFSLEGRYRRHDGEWRWLKSFSRPRLGMGGDVVGFVGVAFDVTEAKRAQVDLTRVNELLEERVGEALAEKAKAEADLMHAQRMEAVGRLTGGVAHDFNNLLTVVIGALDMMLRAPDDAARQKRLGEAALAAARRGERLTHQLLAFSRRQTLRPEPTDLNALIMEGEPLLRRAVGEAVTLDLRLSDRPVWVDVDPAQFEAALLNLVVNARDAVDEGGRVIVETRLRRLKPGQIAELPGGDHVCISVSDDGAGIDPDVLPRIFEPFFTTKSVGKGTGLGLSQVYGFSRQSGGGLQVTSEPGKGASIRMFLPALRRTRPEALDTTPAPERAALPGRRLLLVEDDPDVAAVAAEMIGSLGFSVRTAEDAAGALSVLADAEFDVMLTDVVMPGGMSGVELAQEATLRHPDMSVVLASGYAGDDMDRRMADAPWPFLRKPYSRETLAEVLTADTAV
ncbi:MAG TPA: PAS domain S-box protein [Brevundimonas sp.]|uniref:PAS domain S-box protein n=1 Tax=Brevundimonas sp. TaxID=1871086 RepID=UPI002DF5B5E2|nr:PAS domain S-box protein [Brevundimonas sp.]